MVENNNHTDTNEILKKKDITIPDMYDDSFNPNGNNSKNTYTETKDTKFAHFTDIIKTKNFLKAMVLLAIGFILGYLIAGLG